MSWWWLALPALALPIWWHRQRREHARGGMLATARFATAAMPAQLRAWRWQERVLLALRCLLLLALVAWLAAPRIGWRGDTVLIVPGAEARWVEQQVQGAGMANAARIALPDAQALEWLRGHEGAWRPGARIVVVGDVFMPAVEPAFAHRIELRTVHRALQPETRRVAVHSSRPAIWQAFFRAASTGPVRYEIDPTPGSATALMVWDDAQAPPANARAGLWWTSAPASFPELARAARRAGIVRAVADTPRGRVWLIDADLVEQPASAAALFEAWQELHYRRPPFTAPAQVLAPRAPLAQGGGGGEDARRLLGVAAFALFALERYLAHARRA